MSTFTETTLATTYGNFIFRVYAGHFGLETVALYSPTLNPNSSVLIRIHSECLTGDIFGSLHCDCGEQLEKSLAMIAASKNGILIYLRQEGRGIGLFEKIKSYQLQTEGLDTFAANEKLGHQPDERSYEEAVKVLRDLKISRVELLTNNPNKVSALEKNNITVAKIIPLSGTINLYNQKYLEDKEKFFNPHKENNSF